MSFPSVGSVMSRLFGSAPAAQAPVAATPPGPGNIPADAAARIASVDNQATAPNGMVPATATPALKGLDAFADLFTPVQGQQQNQGQPLFNVDQNKMLEAARNQNFKPIASPEQMQAILAGGEQAAAAMMDLMNDTAQRVYAQSAFASTKLIERGLETSNFAKADALPEAIRRHTTTATMRESNPLFSNPAVQPMIDMAKQQILVKYPNATPSEVAALANDYISSFAEAVNGPKQAAAQAKTTSRETDWSTFA